MRHTKLHASCTILRHRQSRGSGADSRIRGVNADSGYLEGLEIRKCEHLKTRSFVINKAHSACSNDSACTSVRIGAAHKHEHLWGNLRSFHWEPPKTVLNAAGSIQLDQEDSKLYASNCDSLYKSNSFCANTYTKKQEDPEKSLYKRLMESYCQSLLKYT